ncbi:uncharacterized protein LOC120342309 [Styela clava]
MYRCMDSSSSAMAAVSATQDLCAYHRHSCSRPRYQTYKFCAQHVLEDESSPFTSCEYISRSSGRKCPNPALRPRRTSNLPSFCDEHLRDLIAKEQHQKQKRKTKKRRKAGKIKNNFIDAKRQKLIGQIANIGQDSVKVEDGSDSDTEIVHRPITDDWKLENSEDLANNADWDDFDPVNNEVYEPLRYANVLTPEEVVATAQSKLIRLQSLYIEQFKRLFHLLKERKRQYLHDLKKEMKEERISGAASLTEIENIEGMDDDEVYALATYRKRTGVEVLLRKKQQKRRIESSIASTEFPIKSSPRSRCSHASNNTRCKSTCLPYTKYCSAHILEDPHQLLYKKCRTDQCQTPVCFLLARDYEIESNTDDTQPEKVFYCTLHAPLPEMNFSFILEKDKEQNMEVAVTNSPKAAADQLNELLSEKADENHEVEAMEIDIVSSDIPSMPISNFVQEVIKFGTIENEVETSEGLETVVQNESGDQSSANAELKNEEDIKEDTNKSILLKTEMSSNDIQKDLNVRLESTETISSTQSCKPMEQGTISDAPKASIMDLTQPTEEKPTMLEAEDINTLPVSQGDDNLPSKSESKHNSLLEQKSPKEIEPPSSGEIENSGNTKAASESRLDLMPSENSNVPVLSASEDQNIVADVGSNDNQPAETSDNYDSVALPKRSAPDGESLITNLTDKIPLEQIAEVVASLPVVLKRKVKPMQTTSSLLPSSSNNSQHDTPLTSVGDDFGMEHQNVAKDEDNITTVGEVPVTKTDDARTVLDEEPKNPQRWDIPPSKLKGFVTSKEVKPNELVLDIDIPNKDSASNLEQVEDSDEIMRSHLPNNDINCSNENSDTQLPKGSTVIRPDEPSTLPKILKPVLSSFIGHRGERKPSSADEEVAVVSLLSLCTGHPSDDNTQSSSNEQE